MRNKIAKLTWLLGIVASVLAVSNSSAQDVASEGAQEVSIEDFAWIAGSWQGTCFGSPCEEVWSRPSGGTMMGMFKLLKDGEPVFYEIMVIAEDESGWVLKVKHFHANFHAWEDKEDFVGFEFESATPGQLVFNGLKMDLEDDTTLAITLRMRNGDEVSNQRLVMNRVE